MSLTERYLLSVVWQKGNNIKKTTCNDRFSKDASLNGQLRGGDWIDVLTECMTLGEFRITMSEIYYIPNDNILNRVVFRFYVPGWKNEKRKAKYIMDESNILPSANRMKGRYTLLARYQGKSKTKDDNTRMDDVTSTSEYMANVMPRVDVVCFVALCSRLSIVVSPHRLIVVSLLGDQGQIQQGPQ